MKKVFAFSVILFTANAFALDCALPMLSENDINKSKVIFVGVVEGISQDITVNAMEKAEIAVYRVTKAWKGVKTGERVKIYRNSYWGDNSIVGTEYLVAAIEDKGKLWTPSCKRTQHFANEKSNIDVLKKFLSPK